MFGFFNKKLSSKKILDISIKTSAGIPFKWEYEILDNDVVEFVGSKKESLSRKKNICGGPINLIYEFKGLKEGKTSIVFKHIYIGDNHIDSTKEYKVIVDCNLNIKLDVEG